MSKHKELKRALREWPISEKQDSGRFSSDSVRGREAALDSAVAVILEVLCEPDSAMLEAGDNAALGLRIDTSTERRVALTVIWSVMIGAAVFRK